MIPKEIDGVPITKPYGVRERAYIKGWEARQGEIDALQEDVKRCGRNWKAIYCELKTKLERITEAWNSEIKDKEDSVFAGEVHYKLPVKALTGKE